MNSLASIIWEEECDGLGYNCAEVWDCTAYSAVEYEGQYECSNQDPCDPYPEIQ